MPTEQISRYAWECKGSRSFVPATAATRETMAGTNYTCDACGIEQGSIRDGAGRRYAVHMADIVLDPSSPFGFRANSSQAAQS